MKIFCFFMIGFVLYPFSYLFALSLDEALQLALQKNHTIKEQEHLLEEAHYNVKTSQGSFFPKFNAYLQLQENLSKEEKTTTINRNTGETTSATLQLSYNLFNGFIDKSYLQSQESLMRAQSHLLEAAKQDLILAVKEAYIQLLLQKNQLIVAEESLQLLEQQHKETAEYYRVGIVPKNDLLIVEVQLSNAKQNLLIAQSQLRSLQKKLENYIGQKIALESLMEVHFETGISSLEKLKRVMFESRSELKALQEELQSRKHIIQGAKGEYYPIIDAVAEQNFNNAESSNQQSQVRLEVSLNLFNGFATRNNIQAKSHNMLSLNSQIANLKEELDIQLFDSYENYRLALSAYNVAKEALNQAEENYRISSNRYKQRVETTSNLLDAQLLLTQAKTNLLIQHYGILQAIATITRITEMKLE